MKLVIYDALNSLSLPEDRRVAALYVADKLNTDKARRSLFVALGGTLPEPEPRPGKKPIGRPATRDTIRFRYETIPNTESPHAGLFRDPVDRVIIGYGRLMRATGIPEKRIRDLLSKGRGSFQWSRDNISLGRVTKLPD